MHKFNIEAEFSLTTTVEPDGISFDEGGAEDFSDDSYFPGEDITVSGGQVSFTVEATDEHDAEYNEASEIISEGTEVTDYNGLTWLVENVSYTVTKVSEPMTLERATAILQTLAADSDGDNADEVAEAISFILAALAKLSAEVTNLKRVSEANAVTPSVTL